MVKEKTKIKTREEIIANLEKGWSIGMSKYYVNALLFCLGREDLCVDILTEKRFNKIVEEVKK